MQAIMRDIQSNRDHRELDAPVGWGAAVIDDQGNEVPITESMVARACDELARSWTFPRAGTALSR